MRLSVERKILSTALPQMANGVGFVAVGLINTWVIVGASDTRSVAAFATGMVFYSSLVFLFSFLRTTATNWAAIANRSGGSDQAGLLDILMIALLVGVSICISFPFVMELYLRASDVDVAIKVSIANYLNVRLWALPLTLANWSIVGWLYGFEMGKRAAWIFHVLNVASVVSFAFFVGVMKCSVTGAAISALIAECCAFVAGLSLLHRHIRGVAWRRVKFLRIWTQKFWFSNAALFSRSVILLTTNLLFMHFSLGQGEGVVAANHLLLQSMLLVTILYEGVAVGTQVQAANAVIDADAGSLSAVRKSSFRLAVCLTALSFLLINFVTPHLLPIFGGEGSIVRAIDFSFVPFLYFACLAAFTYSFEGYFVGSGRFRPVVAGAFLGLLVFLLVQLTIESEAQPVSVWWAYCAYMGVRAAALILTSSVRRSSFVATEAI